MSFPFPLIATISMPSLELKKKQLQTSYYFTLPRAGTEGKKCCALSSDQQEMTEERISMSVTCCYVLPMLWGKAKGKCESGEICPVETNAIAQHFGRMASAYAGLWSSIAKKDEVEGEKVQQRASRRITIHRVYYKKSLTMDTRFFLAAATAKKG